MTNLKTALIGLTVAAALIGSQALAADVSLAPGKPAGVKEAARHRPNLLLIGGAAALAVGAVVFATQQSKSYVCGAACTPPTTTTG